MTSVREELDALKRWRLKPQYRGLRLFEDLARSEFIPEERQKQLGDRRLAAIARFAASQSPFYRGWYGKRGMSADEVQTVDDLVQLPVLDRETLIDREPDLHAESLPDSEKIAVTAYSSGTTGKRTRVSMTHKSNMMFTILATRLYRWFRLDLSKPMATILAPRSLSDPLDEFPQQDYQDEQNGWQYAGTFFESGRSFMMTSAFDVGHRQEWLERHRPGCLVTYPSVLEEHAFARPDEGVVGSLDAVVGISAQMTEPMRRRIEASFRVPVEQNYGVNEIGIIAGRCRHGRYHVQAEHCCVEIADSAGNPCAPGESGRILVTAFNNLAMPLLRYDTGDLGSVPLGPCPCGRTLPSFDNIEGRYRRWLNVPPGTRRKHMVITDAFEALPSGLLRGVTGYQVHLNLDGTMVLRISSATELPAEMTGPVLSKWAECYPAEAAKLGIERVDRFEVPLSGKIPDFTTDFGEQPYDPTAR